MSYPPRAFRETREDVLLDAVAEIGLASLVVVQGGVPEAVSLPMVATRDGEALVLEGHVALANPLWRLAESGCAALAIFQGPHAYVHPGWYPTKREHGKVVPTWNYVVVQVHGTLSVTRDPDWLAVHLARLTDVKEAGRPEPWSMDDAPADFIAGLLRGIVGLTLHVTRLEGVWKIAQHHPESNRRGVIAGLAVSPDPADRAMAAVMANAERDWSN
ncbi:MULTISPECIES: FMN-binding negative transcriptional regulator [Sphingomonas]|jgi:transcriptional regulator|uniref:FMN-binding negative transcriptional regulator n=1 Tax=Sphingomonas zeae TaxID=1646122 RepID=A0A7Y6B4J6_9SPHN|nr:MULTISPECIES: FMN-binding negative transcriptional regulator [Sphingomonas]MBB4048843.1 transcriptional regulator [Sphingomonas zeae]MDK8186011.1 FMN-binding negative transcriptional regulator [Sphingomonas zeae]MDK8215319.1 FMN-binding negative transcriptional regulator [Sphingomonas sp. UMB7805-LC452B]NUU47320.1 FMN-binding negative transcriptional regulator [Sphingomonas zeae]